MLPIVIQLDLPSRRQGGLTDALVVCPGDRGQSSRIVSTLYPLAETDHPIALVWQARLLARLLPSLGVVAMLATVRPATPRDVPAA